MKAKSFFEIDLPDFFEKVNSDPESLIIRTNDETVDRLYFRILRVREVLHGTKRDRLSFIFENEDIFRRKFRMRAV